ncbi:DUF4097 family beta strand repeat-containing protein [Youngiibacter fragilis]|uniref:DUF4097 domain-containing protein n=1 Tax=Youngiibacter fragilis 232.1 TaxID=994573 RepID=V7I3T9_9CLOT|nr:DUF4097 family beta strand repeat-containing protein [Youngiibacter fragilis]ETA79859.1 hypothetical protein T472_0215150 [Youngiibacter fragilis 232.1]
MDTFRKIIIVCLVVASVSFGIGAWIFYESGFSINEFTSQITKFFESGNLPIIGDNTLTQGFSRTYTFSAEEAEEISVDTSIGDVTVISHDGTDVIVDISGRVSSSYKGTIETAYSRDGKVTVEVLKDSSFSGLLGQNEARIVVSVPAINIEAMSIASVSGKVDIDGIEAHSLKLKTVSGGIEVTGFKAGRLDASSVSGSISADGSFGSDGADISTTSGSIGLKGLEGSFSVNTVSGAVDIEASSMKGGSVVTVSGGVDMGLPSGEFSYDLSSVSGKIRVSRNGSIIESTGSSRENNGNAPLYKVKTVSGGISISQ